MDSLHALFDKEKTLIIKITIALSESGWPEVNIKYTKSARMKWPQHIDLCDM